MNLSGKGFRTIIVRRFMLILFTLAILWAEYSFNKDCITDSDSFGISMLLAYVADIFLFPEVAAFGLLIISLWMRDFTKDKLIADSIVLIIFTCLFVFVIHISFFITSFLHILRDPYYSFREIAFIASLPVISNSFSAYAVIAFIRDRKRRKGVQVN